MVRLLIVDDDPAHRALIKRGLSKTSAEYSFAEAGCITEARKILAQTDIGAVAAVLLDMNLGVERGTVLLQELRTSEKFRLLPVIMLSTSQLAADIRESYAAGADIYLEKNEDSAALGRALAAALRFLLRAP